MKTLWTILLTGFVLLYGVSNLRAESLDDTSGNTPQTASITIFVALVSENLEVTPVPKARFTFTHNQTGVDVSVVTSFRGELTLTLPTGRYLLRSEQPVTFESNNYSWDLSFDLPDTGLELELSNDNATIERAASQHRVAISEEGRIFKRARSAVVTVITEGKKGTGFYIDRRGLIMTNHHVVAGAEYLVIKPDALRKYEAKVLALDGHRDVAILLVHPDVFEGVTPLELAESSKDISPVSVGERVVAIGSPLTTEGILTSGIVSKVDTDAILSDVSINPGNSGGPMLNMLGEVVGINTFGLLSPGSQGVSGTVRIHSAKEAIAEAEAQLAEIGYPSPERLPEASHHPYPSGVLEELVDADLKLRDYHIEMGRIDVQFVTPVVIASLEKMVEIRARKEKEKRTSRGRSSKDVESDDTAEDVAVSKGKGDVGGGFYEWRRYAGDYRPVVTIQATPEIKMTGGSIFLKGLLGAGVPGRYRFKTDFVRMVLLRDGVPVAPLHPGKIREVVSRQTGVDFIEDIGTYGAYEYPPEAFEPSAQLTLEIYESKKPDKPKIRIVSTELQERIWKEFAPYFESLSAAVKSDSED